MTKNLKEKTEILPIFKDLWKESWAIYTPKDGNCANYISLNKLNKKIAKLIKHLQQSNELPMEEVE